MADDIVTSLRAEADAHADGDWNDQVIRRRFTEAADEIERLRKALGLAVEELMIYGPYYRNEPWWLTEGWKYMEDNHE